MTIATTNREWGDFFMRGAGWGVDRGLPFASREKPRALSVKTLGFSACRFLATLLPSRAHSLDLPGLCRDSNRHDRFRYRASSPHSFAPCTALGGLKTDEIPRIAAARARWCF